MFHPLCPALTVLHPGAAAVVMGTSAASPGVNTPTQYRISSYTAPAPAPATGSANQSRGYKPNPFSGLLPLINRPNKLHGGEVHLLPKQQQ